MFYIIFGVIFGYSDIRFSFLFSSNRPSRSRKIDKNIYIKQKVEQNSKW